MLSKYDYLWDVVNEDGNDIYINKVIELKIKIVEDGEEDIFYINYKGYNVAFPMMMWEFNEDIELSPIDSFRLVRYSPDDELFAVAKKDKENLLEEIYFFLVDNNMDSCLRPNYKVNW